MSPGEAPVNQRRGRAGGWPLVGSVLLVIAVIHILATPVFYGEALFSILDAGVVGAIEAAPATIDLHSSAFWYLIAGIALVGVGLDVVWIERRHGAPPVHLGWMLVVLACIGVVLIPVSPFWLFFVAAALVLRSRRAAAATGAKPSQA